MNSHEKIWKASLRMGHKILRIWGMWQVQLHELTCVKLHVYAIVIFFYIGLPLPCYQYHIARNNVFSLPRARHYFPRGLLTRWRRGECKIVTYPHFDVSVTWRQNFLIKTLHVISKYFRKTFYFYYALHENDESLKIYNIFGSLI